MTPSEVGIIVEANRPKYVGGIHEDDIDSMTARRNKLINEGAAVL